MNLLKEGIAQHTVEKTTLTRKLTLDGLTKAYPVYRVRLDQLFYNEQNDRIATWISQYKAQHDGHAPDASNRENYNTIIEQFIVDSNPDAIHKTQTNIEMVDQREPGVVLSDGRIIDGNRRFTCLRRLASKNDRFGFFETVILDRNIENSAKQIKLLELSIQHGEESKVGYNPIDRLVGIYNDITATGLLSVEEYARSTSETEGEVRKRIEIANLMVEFLEFINAPKQFYIARDLQLYYPLEELLKLTKKCSSENEVKNLKSAVFTNILMQTNGDMTRFVRNIKSIIGTEYQEDFLREQQKIAAQIIEKLTLQEKLTPEKLKDAVRSNAEAAQALECSMDKALIKARKAETKSRPIMLTEKASTFLENIDINILAKLNGVELKKLGQQLDRLEDTISIIREYL